ncbi:MAG: hypothetical protein SFW65_00825 [Alphaproteobacteria bacterium]|nr:hypothetical protein [Alphaproteobacteria bacterium]
MPLDTGIHAIPRLKGDERLAPLGKPHRMWVVGSIFGKYGALCQLHDALVHKIRARDRIVYLGNYLGEHSNWTGEATAVIDELITFRNGVIAIPGFFADDVTFLHGRGEDLLHEALRLPFQKNPGIWLMEAKRFGLECYTNAYGAIDIDTIAQAGLINMNKWTHHIKHMISSHKGHEQFFANLKTAAYTQYKPRQNNLKQRDIAFVPTGLHPAYSLNVQHELLCWPEEDIHALTAYQPFARIVRGQALTCTLPEKNRYVLTLDDGKGASGDMGGTLYAACLDAHGNILEWLEF